MRKLLVLLCVVAAAMWLAVPAFAGLTATSHDITNAAGACANCHIPHGAEGGQRLWPSVPQNPAGYTLVGDVAALCGFCHIQGGGFTGGSNAANGTWVYGDLGHGVLMNGGNNPPRAHTDANAFPYMDSTSDAFIECTTCHNVHDDPASGAATSWRPFLRAPIGAICSQCHGQRRFEGGTVTAVNAVGNWGTTNMGNNNPGSHPVGADVSGDVFRVGGSPITIPDIMNVAYPAGTQRDTWAQGGHLTGGATGGVTCATCHAVHGIRFDTADTGGITVADNLAPQGNMLAVGQAQGGADTIGGGSRSIYNGGNGFNALCEACHAAATPEIDAAYNSDTPAPNPGGTSWGHPVDDMDVQDATNWVSAFPTSWPSGSLGASTIADNVNLTNPLVICESCHVPHPNADQGRVDDPRGTFVNSDYILRADSASVCADCHTTGYAGHHPVGITFDDPTGTGAGLGANYLANVTDGGSNQILECATCHYGSGAHNWMEMGQVGLDPAWVPADNGRGDGTRAQDQYDVDASITCMDCHYGLTGAKRMSPTKADGTIEGTPDYNVLGYGSHYIGNLGVRVSYSSMAQYWGSLNAPNRETTLWPGGGWSRFGSIAGGAVLVCESCHELEPTKNTSSVGSYTSTQQRHLLLDWYVEADMTDSRNAFCEGCHLPTGTHPLSGDNVTRPEPDRTLATDAASLSWLATPSLVDANPTMGAAADSNGIFNCDSCHQPHDAASNSLSFILDVTNTVLGGPTATTKLEGGNYVSYGYSFQSGKGGNHQGFCDVCHPYE